MTDQSFLLLKERTNLFVQVIPLYLIHDLGSMFTVDEKYDFIKRVGYGAYGVVCAANDKATSMNVAIKKIPKAFEDLIDAKRVLREIKILSNDFNNNLICRIL